MSKSHPDNHAARLKRGPEAFRKKQERREPESKCFVCGKPCRPQKLTEGVCPICLDRTAAAERTRELLSDYPDEIGQLRR